MRILVLNPVPIFPPISGGELRAYHLVQALARRHAVTVVTFKGAKPFVVPPFPVRVFEVSWKKPRLWREMQSDDPRRAEAAYQKLLNETEEPWFVSGTESPGMEWTLRRIGRAGLDLVLIEHSNMARFLPALPPRVPKILDFVDLHSLMAQREAERVCGEERDQALREAERIARFERRAASQCALCLATSEHEAGAARTLLGIDRVRVVPNGVDVSFFTPAGGAEDPNSLLFTGNMSYGPNVEAVRHFVREILPRIHREVPTAQFHIVGAYPAEEVARLACAHVIVHGQVPDMVPYYQGAAVVVVPLLRGGGTRLKILEAAACGKAIVSTRLGAEGLDFGAGADLMVADSAADFAAAVVRLLRDEPARRCLGQRARRVALRYDWQEIETAFCAVIEKVTQGRTSEGRLFARPKLLPHPVAAPRPSEGIEGRVFLVGCPRSGTTLLQSLLAAHPRIASFPESHFFTNLVPPQGELCTLGIAARKAQARFRAFARELGRPELARLLPKRARLMRRHVRAFVEMLDTLTREQRKDRWVEKTPDHLHVVRVIEHYVPDARFVHLLRNGADVVASLYEVTHQHPRHWHGAWSLDACIAAWNSDLRRSWECRDSANHYFVWYEQLVEDPPTVLRDLCRFLGVDYHADMLARQAHTADSLVLPSEKWKARVAEGLRPAPGTKFQTLFDAQQQAYVRSRLLRLDGWPPGSDRVETARTDGPAGTWADGVGGGREQTAHAGGGVPCF